MHVTSASSTVQRDGTTSSSMSMISNSSLSSDVGCKLEVVDEWTSGLDGTEHFWGFCWTEKHDRWSYLDVGSLFACCKEYYESTVIKRSTRASQSELFNYTCNYMQRYKTFFLFTGTLVNWIMERPVSSFFALIACKGRIHSVYTQIVSDPRSNIVSTLTVLESVCIYKIPLYHGWGLKY